MPRPKKPGAPEPKRRSRNGCWPCKNRKIKCGEEHPNCLNCQKTGEACDYSIRLNWEGRRGKRPQDGVIDFALETPESSSGPAPAPTKGFKLVQQYPSSDVTGARTHERLGPSTSPPKSDQTTVPPLATTSSISTLSPAQAERDDAQRSRKRARFDTGTRTSNSVDKKTPTSSSAATDVSEAASAFLHGSVLSPGESPGNSATLSAHSDEDHRLSGPVDLPFPPSPRARRLSVSSLLSGPLPNARRWEDGSQGPSPLQLRLLKTSISTSENAASPTYYGIDRGFPDRDLGLNDDENAITGSSPLIPRQQLEISPENSESDHYPNEFGFGVQSNDIKEDSGGYYAEPVQIYIPANFEPLPPMLAENPMNLLYFHHFLNHTARVLVPYDDPHANPFRTILPQMAVDNSNLLALLLAYSASHRARVLNQPEPTLRIAFWVDDIFPALRQALDDPDRNFTDANLAIAIMLTSLEIISPKAFGYDIPWQKHLGLARELITVRPGGLRGFRSNFRHDLVCSFLWSWAAYLDVIGSLSGGPKEGSSTWIFQYEYDDIEDGYDEIDCIMGFTTRCIYLLAKIADLAAKCDVQRIDENYEVRPNWRPSKDIVEVAEKLEAEVHDSLGRPPVPCKHIHSKGDLAKWDRVGLSATNEAFHWAALVHLHRRIQGKPSAHVAVQTAVQRIIACLGHIPPGGSAEACLLFPMFTAGCDAQDQRYKNLIMDRFVVAESNGMTQVHNARRLMQKVWETQKPWETLVSTEFIG